MLLHLHRNQMTIMKLLVLYATTEGQTRKIAGFIDNEAQKLGWGVTVKDIVDGPIELEGFDAVLIGASVHMGKYQTAIADFVIRHASELNGKLSGFLSVSLTAAGTDEESWKELHDITDHFLKHCDWMPQRTLQVAGALKYVEYDWLKRMLMRQIAKNAGGSTDTKRDHEYTNWEELKAFVGEFLALKK